MLKRTRDLAPALGVWPATGPAAAGVAGLFLEIRRQQPGQALALVARDLTPAPARGDKKRPHPLRV